jgi:hypothetical protein
MPLGIFSADVSVDFVTQACFTPLGIFSADVSVDLTRVLGF